MTRSGFSGKAQTPIAPVVTKNVEPQRPIFEKPKQDQEEGEEYDDEDDYDDEDEPEVASKSFFVGPDQPQMAGGPTSLANLSAAKRN